MTDQAASDRAAGNRVASVAATSAAARHRASARYLLADALVFPLAAYELTGAALLRAEGVIGTARLVLWVALFLPPVVALGVLAGKRLAWRRIHPLAIDLAALAVSAVALPLAYLRWRPDLAVDVEHPQPIFCPLFLPIEWLKFPANVALIARSIPGHALALAVAVVLAGVVFFRGRHGKALERALYVVFAGVVVLIAGAEFDQKAPFFVVTFGLPILTLARAARRDWPRTWIRSSILAYVFLLIPLFYMGAFPLAPLRGTPDPAVHVLFPRPGEASPVPTSFFRDVFVDEERALLFTSYGPTSGLVRLDLAAVARGDDHVLDVLDTDGVYRHFRTPPGTNRLVTVDWVTTLLDVFEREPFRMVDRRPIRDPVLLQPIDLEVAPEGLFVASSELPAVTRLDPETLAVTARLDLRERGITRFRSGVWVMARDPATGRLFVHAGMLDASGHYVVLRLDPTTLAVPGPEDRVDLGPHGGLTLVPVPEKRAVLLGDFYSRAVIVIDMDTLATRTVETLLNPRSIAYDPRRDLLYVASYMKGELGAYRWSDGAEVARTPIGNKPSGLHLSTARDTLYLGSSLGLLAVDLASWLRGP